MAARKSAWPREAEALREIADAGARGYRYYVYTLADADGVFYVGKGQGGRMFQHGRGDRDCNSAKRLRIALCGSAGPTRTVVAFFNDEIDACLCEAERIFEGQGSLTNIAGGSLRLTSRQRVQLDNLLFLARIPSRERFKPKPGTDPAAEFALYDVLVAHAKREAANPTPTMFGWDPVARKAYYGYGPSRTP